MTEHPNAFYGMRVMESDVLTVAGAPVTVTRTWRERLLSRPWRPLVPTRTFIPQVPNPQMFQIGPSTLVGHPATVRALREAVNDGR